MAENTQNNPQEEREAAVQEWEKQTNRPVVADDRKKQMTGVAIGLMAVFALGAVWYIKNGQGSSTQQMAANSELTIPERRPVPRLKEEEQPIAPIAEPSPTPASVTAQSNYDPNQAQLDELERQRQEEQRRMLEARLKSSLVPTHPNQTMGGGGGGAPVNAQPGAGGMQGNTGGLFGGDSGQQDSNSLFAQSVSGAGVAVSRVTQIDNLEYKVLQGKMIEGVLQPRANSDLPGTICATVQRDVYGEQGRVKLIPWGSRVCGVYNADIQKGQERIFTVWNHLRTPDGQDIALDSPGADQLGTAGMGGIVDTHFAEIFGMSALLSIIGAGAANVGVSGDDRYNSGAYYRQEVQRAAAQTAQQVLQPYLSIQPTITVPHGSRVRIYINRDLDFTDMYKEDIAAAQRGGVMFLQ
ncbi:TPA: TrbI/VirB10 family protein [Klebsiella pneumoniae]